MTLSRRNFTKATGLIALGQLASTPGFAQAPALSCVAANPAHIMNYVPHIIAVTQKFMANEGVDLKLITSGGGSKLREIVAAGQVQFAIGDSSHVIQLINRGKPAKILMGVDTRSPITNIVVRKDLFDKGITTVEKLAAMKRPDGSKPIIAVSTIGGGQHVYASYIFEKLGVYNKMNWIGGGVTATMLGGLKTAKFDAMVAAPSWQFEAVEKNFGRLIFDATNDVVWNTYFAGPMPATCIYTLQSTIDAQPALVQAYVNGMYRSMQWLKDASPNAIWDASGEKYFGELGKDASIKEAAFFKSLFNYSGLVSQSAFNNGGRVWFRESTEMKPTTYAEAVDLSFLANSRHKYG
jgi:NitT/TauT family transport system substrate-binding protein